MKKDNVKQEIQETSKKEICNELPTELEIVGVAIDRSIFIQGKKLFPDKANGCAGSVKKFNWGYEGQEPSHLALAILLEYLPAVVAVQYAKILSLMVISKIESNNFKILLSLKLLMKDILNNSLKGVDEDGVSPYFDVEELKLKEAE